MQKKIFSVRIPCKWPRDFTSENFSEFLKFFHINCFGSILSTWNGLKWLLVIAIMFCFIHFSVKWSEKVWFSGNSAKNGQKIGKICKNQGFWPLDQTWLIRFTWESLQMIIITFYFIFCNVRWPKKGQICLKFGQIWAKIGQNMQKSRFLTLWSKLTFYFGL